VLTLAVLFKS